MLERRRSLNTNLVPNTIRATLVRKASQEAGERQPSIKVGYKLIPAAISLKRDALESNYSWHELATNNFFPCRSPRCLILQRTTRHLTHQRQRRRCCSNDDSWIFWMTSSFTDRMLKVNEEVLRLQGLEKYVCITHAEITIHYDLSKVMQWCGFFQLLQCLWNSLLLLTLLFISLVIQSKTLTSQRKYYLMNFSMAIFPCYLNESNYHIIQTML